MRYEYFGCRGFQQVAHEYLDIGQLEVRRAGD